MNSPDLSRALLSAQMEQAFEWRAWIGKIPAIEFPKGWLVTIIPPSGGAVVRFLVQTKATKGKTVSVYLDCYEQLGFFGGPHWEIYPDDEGDNARFAMADTQGLLAAIKKSLRRIAKEAA